MYYSHRIAESATIAPYCSAANRSISIHCRRLIWMIIVSENKKLMRWCEVVATILGVTGFVGACLLSLQVMSLSFVEKLLPYIFVTGMLVFFASLLVLNDYARLVRNVAPGQKNTDGLSIREMKQLVFWCPTWLWWTSIIIGAICMGVLMYLGEVTWSSSAPLDARTAIGLLAGSSFFVFASIPILASASRMPGAFDDHFESPLHDS